jgi:hypothetical protein
MLGGNAVYGRFVSEGLGKGYMEKLLSQEPEKAPKPRSRRSIDSWVKEIAKWMGTEVQALRSPDRSWAISKVRTRIAHISVRRLGYSLNGAAAYFGSDPATMATLLALLSDRMQSEEKRNAN